MTEPQIEQSQRREVGMGPPLGLRTQQQPQVAAILRSIRSRLRAEGWSPTDSGGLSLVGALMSEPATVARHDARRFLQFVAFDVDLAGWEAHPYRDERDVLHLLEKAIRAALGREMPKARRHAGGHYVTTRAPRPKVVALAGVGR